MLNNAQQFRYMDRVFFGEKIGDLAKIMNWPGGHLLQITQVDNRLVLYASFYDVQKALITISSEPEQWRDIVDEGLVYVIAPGDTKICWANAYK